MNPDGTFGLAVVPVVIAALALVALAVAISARLHIGVERSIVWAAVRATVQLLAVGLLFTLIFDSGLADLWAWLWVASMVTVSVFVIVHRAPSVPGVWPPALFAVAAGAFLSVIVIFGFGVLELEPVRLVVIVGITMGNSMPAAVGGVAQTAAIVKNRRGEVEALLALGSERRHVIRYVAPEASRLALVPYIERVKVVGLIALPGAMTGLLLAGVDPIDAVVIQLLVMFIILGAVALSVLTLVLTVASSAVTPDLRLSVWSTESDVI